jgi:hypothetical protein
MRYGLTLFLLSMLAGSLALPQSNTTSSTPTSKTPTSNTTKKPQASSTKSSPKTASSKKTVKTVASKKGKSAKKPVAVATYRQIAPTPDRYREIQQALIDKGYLKSEPNGVWDAPSQDALRQFQTDQKLSPTGKLSAPSLIALGLGPKTGAASVSPPPAAIDNPPPATIETPSPATIETPPAATAPAPASAN